jgi:hypothetical protein
MDVRVGVLVAWGLCQGCGDVVRGGGEDLEDGWGGFDFRAEEPLFGDAQRAEFVAAGESAVPRAMTTTSSSTSPSPGAQAVWVTWGHVLVDRQEPAWTDWSGSLVTQSGTLTLSRTLAFDAHDRILDPPDDRTVAWESRTRPHFDGVVARATVPPGASLPVLTLSTPPVTVTHQARDVPAMQVTRVDGTTLEVWVLSVPLNLEEPCARAVVVGRWRDVPDRPRARGTVEARLVGRWLTPEGVLVGHWRGFTGHRRDGQEVLFAKVIDPDGTALALVRGPIHGDIASLEVVTPGHQAAGGAEVRLDRDGVSRSPVVAVAEMSRCLAGAPGSP